MCSQGRLPRGGGAQAAVAGVRCCGAGRQHACGAIAWPVAGGDPARWRGSGGRARRCAVQRRAAWRWPGRGAAATAAGALCWSPSMLQVADTVADAEGAVACRECCGRSPTCVECWRRRPRRASRRCCCAVRQRGCSVQQRIAWMRQTVAGAGRAVGAAPWQRGHRRAGLWRSRPHLGRSK